MAKRHNYYKGSYVKNPRSCLLYNLLDKHSVDLQNYIDKFNDYLMKAYTIVNERYVFVVTVLLVGLLGLLLPDISYKIHKSNELKAMKDTVDLMTKEVSKAEAACLTVADDMCYLQCSMRDDETETSTNLRDLSACTSECLRDTQSEPVQIEKKVGLFRRILFPNRKASHREIAIMSFVYSDSFTNQKTNRTHDPSILNLKMLNNE